MTTYDLVIVGAGMSGLYAAYQVRLKRPHWRIAVLEKADHIGGRAGTLSFHGARIQIGAGIGRYPYDKTLLALCRALHVDTPMFDHVTDYSVDIPYPVNLKETVAKVKRHYKPHGRHRGATFREVAIDVLGQHEYDQFRTTMGYTDWENEDPEESFRTLHIDDEGWDWSKAVSIPWNDLLQGMVRVIGRGSVHCGEEVVSLDDGFVVKTRSLSPSLSLWPARRVIVSTDIRGVRKLVANNKVYRDIQPMPFLRVYAHFDAASAAVLERLVPHVTVVATPLYKIIPMGHGVYMVAYTDNAGYRYYAQRHRADMHRPAFWAREVERALHLPTGTLVVDDLSVHDWPVGTHYFRPLPLLSGKKEHRSNVTKKRCFKNRAAFLREAQRPLPHLWIVGEGMSRDQGWTEGALDSVRAVLADVLRP